MSEPRIIAEPFPPKAWRETVERGVDNHNVAVTGLSDYYPVGFFVLGANGEVMAGLLGGIWGGWMHVWRLWVSQKLRGRGCGRELMARAHRYAIGKGCAYSFLNTASYEARPFYEKLGYQTYAELQDHPVAPHRRYYLLRALDAGSASLANQTDFEIVMNPYPSEEMDIAVQIGIAYHAQAAIGLPETEWRPHNFFLLDDDGEVVGGVLGNLWGDWMYASYVWVDRAYRGKGHASRLMREAERAALALGASKAFLDTFSFQARPLYEKLGYQVFGELKDHPKGHSQYFLKKQLVPER